jgi:hypothetical protein
MTWREVVRVAVGIAIGLGLASLPFLQYGVHTHHHRPHIAHAHRHAR